ncbi:MAG: hypothetical protein R2708_07095 [Vicinamibacterales bacterium]
MRIAALTLLALAGLAGGARAQTSSPPRPSPARPAPAAAADAAIRPVGTMRELMAHVIRPSSDAVFYITSRTPASGEDWAVLQGQTLALAEAGTVLMLPAHARGRARWLADARLMRDAGRKAFEAAKAKDVAALEALNDELYTSCTTCHEHFDPRKGKGQGR